MKRTFPLRYKKTLVIVYNVVMNVYLKGIGVVCVVVVSLE